MTDRRRPVPARRPTIPLLTLLAVIVAACGPGNQPPDPPRPAPTTTTVDARALARELDRLRAEVARLEHELHVSNVDQQAIHRRLDQQRPARTRTARTPTTPPVSSETKPGPCGGWDSLVAAHWPPAEHARACRILLCESRGNPNARNPRSTASGLWQFLDSTWRRVTGRADRAVDATPAEQTAAAARLWRSSGWRPWVCK